MNPTEHPACEPFLERAMDFLCDVMRGCVDVWNGRPVGLDERIAAARLLIELSLEEPRNLDGTRRALRAYPVVLVERQGWARVAVIVLPGHRHRSPEARMQPVVSPDSPTGE